MASRAEGRPVVPPGRAIRPPASSDHHVRQGKQGAVVRGSGPAPQPASRDASYAAEADLALEEEKIERGRRDPESRQDRVSLPAVVGLVVEEVVEGGRQFLLVALGRGRAREQGSRGLLR